MRPETFSDYQADYATLPLALRRGGDTYEERMLATTNSAPFRPVSPLEVDKLAPARESALRILDQATQVEAK